MKKRLYIPLLVFCIFSFHALSQTLSKKELDNKYTPNQNSVFNSLYKDNRIGLTHDNVSNRIKFSPTLFLRQKIGLQYERSLFHPISVNIGVAKAFGTDVFQSAGLKVSADDYDINTLSAADLMNDATYYSSNLFLSASLRCYISEDVLEGSFIEINYLRETMKFRISPFTQENYRIVGSNIADFKMNGIYFGYGFSGFIGKSRFSQEIVIHVGIRNFNYSQFLLNNNSVNSNEFFYQKTSFDLQTRIMPSIQFAYRLGFGFN